MEPKVPDIERELWALLAQVPPGRVTTPGALAAALGDPIAARWVGSVLQHHAHGPACPCHRVVLADGRPGSHGDPQLEKRRKLQAEGVSWREGRVDLRRPFKTFRGERPLARLREAQSALRARLSLVPWPELPAEVGGVDLAYRPDGTAVAAYALVREGRLRWTRGVVRPVSFPYITSYLSFRELPLLVALLEEVRAQGRLAPVVLVDGTGVLHPRGVGIASHLGIVTGVPTVGVIKSLLCGQVRTGGMRPGEARPVRHDGRTVGMALQSRAGTKPIYVSPGQGIDLESALRLVRATLGGHKLPEPLYWADRLSRRWAHEQEGTPALDLD